MEGDRDDEADAEEKTARLGQYATCGDKAKQPAGLTLRTSKAPALNADQESADLGCGHSCRRGRQETW